MKQPPVFELLTPPLNYPSGFTPRFNDKAVNSNSMNLDTIGWMDWLMDQEKQLEQIGTSPVDYRQLIIGAFEYYLHYLIREAKTLIADDYLAGAAKHAALLQNKQSDDALEAVVSKPSAQDTDETAVSPVAAARSSHGVVASTDADQVPYDTSLSHMVEEAEEDENPPETEQEEQDQTQESSPEKTSKEITLQAFVNQELASIEVFESEQIKVENQFPQGASVEFAPLFFECIKNEQTYRNYSEAEIIQTKTLLGRALQDLSTYPLSQIIELAVQCGVSAALIRSSLCSVATRPQYLAQDFEFMEVLASNEALRRKWNRYIRCMKGANLRDFLINFFGQNTQVTTLRLYARFSANNEDVTLADIQKWRQTKES